MSETRVIASHLVEDDRVTGADVRPCIEDARALGLRVVEWEIQPLSVGWEAEPAGTFKSGAGPIFALDAAMAQLAEDADVVRIHGRDHLRAFSSDARQRQMAIYGDVSIPEAYTMLAAEFARRHDISDCDFARLARALEANMRETALSRGLQVAPKGTHDAMVTSLFRMVDCANPVINFEADLVVATERGASTLGINGPAIACVACDEVQDGPDHVSALARYDHLERLVARCGVAELDPAEIALELYTCFPVVPLAFIWTAGWATTVDNALKLLAEVPITLSGGMNFARAPWNNPALRGLILAARSGRNAVVHGNGGLGGRQGVAVIRAA